MNPGRERHIDLDLPQDLAVGIEYLDASIAAIRHVDIALGVGRDAVRRIELSGPASRLTKRLHPVAVLVELGHARIDVAVADEDIPLRVPGDVGRLPKLSVDWRTRRIDALPG